MAILWAGTSIADMGVISGATVTTDTGIISANVSEGVRCENAQSALSPTFAPIDTLWLAETYRWNAATNPNDTSRNIAFISDDNMVIMRFRNLDSGGVHAFEKWNGTAWTQITRTLVGIVGTNRIDIGIKLAIDGFIKLYVNGGVLLDFSGDTLPTGSSNISQVLFGSGRGSSSYYCAHSAILIADEDTRSFNLLQKLPTGNGAETAWTGDYTSVDETGINDADFVSSGVVGQLETFTFPALASGFDNNALKAVVLAGRSQGSGSPGNIRGVARVGGVNYDIAGEKDTSVSFGSQQWIFETNPATSQPWLGSEVNASQFGVKST